MEALYHQTNRILQETQQYFQSLTIDKPDLEKELQARIDQITRWVLRISYNLYFFILVKFGIA